MIAVLRERGALSNDFIEVAHGTHAATSADIGVLDPTRLHNGLWMLVLEATDLSGNVGQSSVLVSVGGDMKPGHFAISFNDLTVPVAGLPITVTRTAQAAARRRRTTRAATSRRSRMPTVCSRPRPTTATATR